MKVLVVEDSKTMRKLVAIAVRRMGFTPVEAEDGADALEKMNQNEGIGGIITDLNMPNMNGVELVRKVRENDPNIPILMLTTEGENTDKEQAKAAGIDVFVTKGGNYAEEVIREFSALLEQKKRG